MVKFLTDARIPFLNDYLSETLQSTLFEIVFWILVVLVYFNLASHLVRALFRRLPIWSLAHKRGGVLCGNGRDDSVLSAIVGIHHFVAGYLMFLGLQRGDADLWRHGYLLENGYEAADLIALVLRLYPFRWDGIKPELKIALVLHHVPGLLISAFVMESALYENPHIQAIGLWLLLGAGVSCAVNVLIYLLCLDTQMPLAASAAWGSFLFFVYCRFCVFPKESFALISEVKQVETTSTSLLVMLYTYVVMLSLFNTAIFVDLLPKAIRYGMRAMDGTTPIETKAVPQSRDSVLLGKRVEVAVRRTSLLSASLASVMHMNTMEDMVASGNTALTVDDDDNELFDELREEEAECLKGTLSLISESIKKVN